MTIASLLKSAAAKFAGATRDLKDELLKMRERIGATREQLRRLQEDRLPIAEVVRDVIPRVVAEAGAFWLQDRGNALLAGNFALAAPSVTGSRQLPWAITDPLPWGAFCVAFPDQAAQLLEGLLRAVPYEEGLPSAERPALIERLTRELAELEAAEERFVDEAAEAGVVIEHRPEVITRRQNEARRLEREARDAAVRQEREAAINARQSAPTPPVRSEYLHRGDAERAALRGQ